MDVQDIVGQLIKAGADNPEILDKLGVNPSEAVKHATGLDLDDNQIGDVLKAVEGMTSGEGLNPQGLLEIAGDFLGGDDGILGKLGSLFGGK